MLTPVVAKTNLFFFPALWRFTRCQPDSTRIMFKKERFTEDATRVSRRVTISPLQNKFDHPRSWAQPAKLLRHNLCAGCYSCLFLLFKPVSRNPVETIPTLDCFKPNPFWPRFHHTKIYQVLCNRGSTVLILIQFWFWNWPQHLLDVSPMLTQKKTGCASIPNDQLALFWSPKTAILALIISPTPTDQELNSSPRCLLF